MPTLTGILLANLGSPAEPTAQAVRGYLREFLNDPAVVDWPRWLWRPILNGIVLKRRPARVAAAYAKIWTPEGPPLLVHSVKLAELLAVELKAHRPETCVALGMRYGHPSLAKALAALRDAGCTRLIGLPLYPQFSHSTTGSTRQAVEKILHEFAWLMPCDWILGYHDHPSYIAALSTGVRSFWQQHGQPQKLLMSFHGLPRRYVRRGDPYLEQCLGTARLLAKTLRLAPDSWQVTFQSRFGPEPWLQPDTSCILRKSARAGVKSADVICPGFAVDCLETLEEVALRYREIFLSAGGKEFHYLPALNTNPKHVQTLTHLVLSST